MGEGAHCAKEPPPGPSKEGETGPRAGVWDAPEQNPTTQVGLSSRLALRGPLLAAWRAAPRLLGLPDRVALGLSAGPAAVARAVVKQGEQRRGDR